MEKKFQSDNVLLISIAHMVHDIYSSFLAPILPLLIEKLGMTYTMAGFLAVAQRLPSLLNPVIGIIADKISVRYFIIAAPSITAVSMSLLGVVPGYKSLIMLLFIMGLSSVMFHVPAPVMIRKLAGDQIGKGMSFYMLGGEIARTLGPLIILGAVSLWGLAGTYRLIPFGATASVILYFKIRKIRISDEFKKNGSELIGIKETLKGFVPLFLRLSAITFFRAVMKGALTTFLPTYITVKGGSLWLGGISLVILQLAGAAGAFSAGTISDRFGRKKVLIVVSVLSPILMWLFMTVNTIFTIPILIMLGITILSTGPVMLAAVNERKNDHPSFINGIYMTINFMISALTIMLTGSLGDIFGLEFTFSLSAGLALLAIPFAVKL
ncbi:MAG: MFS transporter [Desulfobacterales bacterium]|nr:MFS transporter [Desulfobacterales bacterium]